MKLINIVVLLLAALLGQTAAASVMYPWQTTALSGNITSAEGWIEITDAAAKTGHVDYLSPDCHDVPCTDAFSPIVSFYFAVNGQSYYQPRNAEGLTFHSYSFLRTQFSIEGYHLTNFSLSANNTFADVTISNGVSFNTDVPGPCSAGTCSGATGRFGTVPEPGSVLLIALGIALALHRRKSSLQRGAEHY